MVPVLHYEPPVNTYKSASAPPDDYSFNQFNASVQIYPFRPFNGNLVQMFQTTLFRDWIDPRYQEQNVAMPPTIQALAVPGAQAAVIGSFSENIVGLLRPHNRLVIASGPWVAIVDASASAPATWQMALPTLSAMMGTLRVDAAPERPSTTRGPGLAGRAIAGLYEGTKPKYVVDLTRPVGFGQNWVTALHFYLFSRSGRVYRAYDRLPVPENDPERVDFDALQKADPGNSGRYTVDNGQLHVHMGGPDAETIVAPVPADGRLVINSVVYLRR